MRISNITGRSILLCGFGIALPLSADDLTLVDGASHLTGTVRSIDADGRVELSSPLSPEPLLLKADRIEKVEFSNGDTTEEPPSALVQLTNGDLLPATVESLDDRNLTINSPDAGRLEILRNHLTSAQFGIRPHEVLYSGPKSLNEWAGNWGDPNNWTFARGSLVANGPATAARKFTLPRQFILRFTLVWEAKEVPNFKVYFADPLTGKPQPCDRYYLQFGGAGLEIKREASEGRRYNPILQLNRTPNQYPDHELKVEIHVNRNDSRLQLFLNGEPEDKKADPISPVPDGSGITLICNAPSGNVQQIRDIEITEFDDSRVRHHSEERGNPQEDSLISREEDRWGGRLIDIGKTADGTVFRFKSDFRNDPLEIPETDVSTVFFASEEAGGSDGRQAPFVIRLRGEGSLRVTSCRFTQDTVSAIHPLLGPLELRRDGIVSMQRSNPEPNPAPEP